MAQDGSEAGPDYGFAFVLLWTLIAGALVMLMQAGFAMVEAGFTRAKNVCNIIMKNVLDFSFGSLLFFFIGFGLMFGATKGGFFGTTLFGLDLTTGEEGMADGGTAWLYTFWFFQTVFAATAATIVSGAMAERTKFVGYLIYTCFLTALIYPIFGHWAWGSLYNAGSGWLEGLGFYDFAGSTVVHSVGAWAGLAGALVLGPRLGKFTKDGKPLAIPGHSMPLAALGTFILWFGWYGFNAGSTTDGASGAIGYIAATTTLAACAGVVASMATTWVIFKKPDTGLTLNGALAGLVGITAGCDAVPLWAAIVIGLVAGVVVVLAIMGFEHILKIDDPVGAISVHGVCGAWGTLAVGIFAPASASLLTQAIGVAAAFAFVFPIMFVFFFVLKKLGLLRVSEEEEVAGLDVIEHGNEAYPASGYGVGSPYGQGSYPAPAASIAAKPAPAASELPAT
ncbi:MAG: ammonium transporter [Sumerlaeia bacterium]